mmetsp:Transcript_8670/g.30758  ORF Transcript_8670/g.30758 Transcript_8670/m.30758 type:complete len:363 (+) Transcript_8670:2715-3803(+)
MGRLAAVDREVGAVGRDAVVVHVLRHAARNLHSGLARLNLDLRGVRVEGEQRRGGLGVGVDDNTLDAVAVEPHAALDRRRGSVLDVQPAAVRAGGSGDVDLLDLNSRAGLVVAVDGLVLVSPGDEVDHQVDLVAVRLGQAHHRVVELVLDDELVRDRAGEEVGDRERPRRRLEVLEAAVRGRGLGRVEEDADARARARGARADLVRRELRVRHRDLRRVVVVRRVLPAELDRVRAAAARVRDRGQLDEQRLVLRLVERRVLVGDEQIGGRRGALEERREEAVRLRGDLVPCHGERAGAERAVGARPADAGAPRRARLRVAGATIVGAARAVAGARVGAVRARDREQRKGRNHRDRLHRRSRE